VRGWRREGGGAERLVTTDEDFAGIRAFEVELIRPA
jgi:hypothetical protein